MAYAEASSRVAASSATIRRTAGENLCIVQRTCASWCCYGRSRPKTKRTGSDCMSVMKSPRNEPAVTTIVNDGQYRWTIDTESLLKGMITNGYRASEKNGWPIAVEPGGEAYSDLCSGVGYEWSSDDGPEDRAKIDAIEEAETMTYREDWQAWELSPGLHDALWYAEPEAKRE